MANIDRHLSPHLQVYRWKLTMAMSILHRMTGVGLAFGAIILTWWLLAAWMGPQSFAQFHDLAHSIVGQLMLFGWVWAFSYHFFNGIRHMVWDTGRWLDLKHAFASGWVVLILSFISAGAIWCAATN